MNKSALSNSPEKYLDDFHMAAKPDAFEHNGMM